MQTQNEIRCQSRDIRPQWRRSLDVTLTALVVRLTLAWERLMRLRTLSVEALEIAFALVELVIGIAYIHPNQLTLAQTTVKTLGDLLPMPLRACGLVLAGLLTIIGYADAQTGLRRLGRVLGMGYWLYLGALTFIKTPTFYYWMVNLLFAFYDYWAYSKVGENAIKSRYASRVKERRVEAVAGEIAAIALRHSFSRYNLSNTNVSDTAL